MRVKVKVSSGFVLVDPKTRKMSEREFQARLFNRRIEIFLRVITGTKLSTEADRAKTTVLLIEGRINSLLRAMQENDLIWGISEQTIDLHGVGHVAGLRNYGFAYWDFRICRLMAELDLPLSPTVENLLNWRRTRDATLGQG